MISGEKQNRETGEEDERTLLNEHRFEGNTAALLVVQLVASGPEINAAWIDLAQKSTIAGWDRGTLA